MTPPRVPRPLAGRLRELDRWSWDAGQGGDPHAALAGFLSGAGLPVDDLATPSRTVAGGRVAGAAVLLGSAALAPADRAHHPARPSPCPEVPDVVAVLYGDGGAAPPRPGAGGPGAWEPSWTPEQHAAAVAAVREDIARGELYQANLVGHRSAPWWGDPLAAAVALARVPDTPYAGALAGDGWAVCSASPESFLHVARGVATVRPIKGTRVRGRTPAADAAAAAELRGSGKDRAEHVMIVDLERNDLGRVACTGSVTVRELYAVRPLAGLWHAESTVTARLRPGTGLAELLAATFPGGSVTGAPKLAALAEIARREPVGRGPSMGAFGWVGADGSLDLGLTIRTVAVAGGRVHLWTGGGITWGSEPAAEVAEAAAKAAPLLAALGG